MNTLSALLNGEEFKEQIRDRFGKLRWNSEIPEARILPRTTSGLRNMPAALSG